MSNNINSFAENMNTLVKTSVNQISMLQGFQNSMISNGTSASFTLINPETGQTNVYSVPAYQGIINRLEGMENTIRALLNGKGTATLSDMTSREIQITPLAKVPNNVYINSNPTTFNIDSNWFFEDLMFPGITVSVDLTGQVDDNSDRVRVKRVILDSRKSANQTIWNNNLAGASISYMDLISLLNREGIEYSEDEETLEFPVVTRNYEGSFTIVASNIINDVIWYTLDTFDYFEVTPNGTSTSSLKTLVIGDQLSYNNTVLEIENINYGERRVSFKYYIGNETPGINSFLEYYEQPFKTKVLDIRIGIHEYDIIYFKSINETFNLVASSWGYPMSFYSDNLVNSNGVPLSIYYANNIVDWGTQLIAEAKNKTITAFEGVIPDAPVLNEDNFSVVQINTQINAALDVTEFKNIVADIDTTKSNINTLRNTIAAQKSDLQSIISLDEYQNLQKQINSNTLDLKQLQNSYRTLLNQAHDLVKENRSVVKSPKYHIRGFFPIPNPKTNISTSGIVTSQQVIGFEIQYRYIKEDATGVDLKSYSYLESDGISTVTGIYSDWNIMATQTLEKAYNEATAAYEWVQQSISDGTIININQVDIPISKGEKVEFRIRSISEAGWPSNPLKSEWSNSIIIAFPENLSTVSEADNLVEDINNENINLSIDNILNSLGVYTHLNDSIPNINSVNGLYYNHQAENIAYELITSTGDGINKTVETISVQEAIDRLINNKTTESYLKEEIDFKAKNWSRTWIKTTLSAQNIPIPLYNDNNEIIYDKIYLTENSNKTGYNAWILELEELDLNHDGKVDVSDINIAINRMIKDPSIDGANHIISIKDFILGYTTIKDYWKPITGELSTVIETTATDMTNTLRANVIDLQNQINELRTAVETLIAIP